MTNPSPLTCETCGADPFCVGFLYPWNGDPKRERYYCEAHCEHDCCASVADWRMANGGCWSCGEANLRGGRCYEHTPETKESPYADVYMVTMNPDRANPLIKRGVRVFARELDLGLEPGEEFVLAGIRYSRDPVKPSYGEGVDGVITLDPSSLTQEERNELLVDTYDSTVKTGER